MNNKLEYKIKKKKSSTHLFIYSRSVNWIAAPQKRAHDVQAFLSLAPSLLSIQTGMFWDMVKIA